ncbi:hypothetical protein MHYP_G00206640 [Metynnis hypsauchen]
MVHDHGLGARPQLTSLMKLAPGDLLSGSVGRGHTHSIQSELAEGAGADEVGGALARLAYKGRFRVQGSPSRSRASPSCRRTERVACETEAAARRWCRRARARTALSSRRGAERRAPTILPRVT